MLTPERMRRVLVVTTREDARSLIETLHDLHAVHLIEHRRGESDLDIGRPLAEGSRASGQLVRLRGLLRQLDAEAHAPGRSFSASSIDAQIDATLDRLERDVGHVADEVAKLDAARADKVAEKAKLAPLAPLPLPLEAYRGYDSLKVFVGTVADDPSADVVAAAANEAEVFVADGTVAAFVPLERAEAVQNALLQHGFKELEVPGGTGGPVARGHALDAEIAALDARLAEGRARLAQRKAENADFLKASEEHLSIEVEKAEAPLAFGATDHAFVLEAWIPEGSMEALQSSLRGALGDRVHLEFLPDAPPDAAHGAADAHEAHEHAHEEKEEDLPPTRMKNPAAARPFEFFTQMFSTPRYGEIDPTLVLAFAFPVFFGFMIGDAGLGLVMLALGVLMARKLKNVEGVSQLGVAIALAGLVAAVTGTVVFQDAFGVPFGGPEHELEHIGATMTPPVAASALGCADLAHHGLTTWSCILSHEVAITHPLIIKTLDVPVMLLISLLAGLAHLTLGLLFGIRNEIGHSKKHALAKFGWLILLGGFFLAALWLLNKPTLGPLVDLALPIAGVTTVVAAVILVATEGGLALLEIPSMFSNILSYLRLGAVAIAKGAMAVAFNGLTLVAALEGAGVVVVLGLVGFLVAQVVLFVLGVLSSGIQAIRLNYVEFFTKFYKGGGRPFRPFGQPRKFTTKS